MADRKNRIQSIIAKSISEIILFEMKDPKLSLCTVKEVKVSNDFSYAKVYVSFITNNHDDEKRLEILNNAKGYIRSELAKRLDIRRTPELSFYLDDSFDRYERINEILKKNN